MRSAARRLLTTIDLLALIFVLYSSSAFAQTVLQGTIRDSSTNAPIVGVKLGFCNTCGTLTLTDANGQYSLTANQLNNNSSGSLLLQAVGYFAGFRSYCVTASPTTADFTLLPGGTIIQGTVTD